MDVYCECNSSLKPLEKLSFQRLALQYVCGIRHTVLKIAATKVQIMCGTRILLQFSSDVPCPCSNEFAGRTKDTAGR